MVRLHPLLLALISLLVLQWTNPASAIAAKKTKPGKRAVPAALIKWPKENADYAILVDKSTQKIFLYHMDNLSRPFKVFRCSTGENSGPKTRQNDKKTPEGVYFFTNCHIEKELSPIYGVRAFPVDYPSPIDSKEGKDGYGIWFHGTNKPLKPNDSNGCIVLENKSINELAPYIKVNDTPAIISSRIKLLDPVKLKYESEKLERIIKGWRNAWETKHIKDYMSFYSPQFSSKGKNWHGWKKYKTRLARKYKRIHVEIDNLRLLSVNGTVLAKFHQRYTTAGFESRGEKRLYLKQNSNQWKIVGEFFEEDKKKKKPASKKPRISSLKEVKNFIYLWKKAWETKDLKTYISCYDPGFRSRGMNLRAWKKHRKRLNIQYRSFKIKISDLKIVQDSINKAKVSFKQDYRANGYHDFGIKEISLIKRGRHWKIKKEEWRPLRRKSRR